MVPLGEVLRVANGQRRGAFSKMNTQATTTTGHILELDRPARRLRVIAGNIATIVHIPHADIKDFLRGHACRVASWELVEPAAWRIETHEDLVSRRR